MISFRKTLVTSSVALMIAACGGSDGTPAAGSAEKSLTLGGTAAVGAALGDAGVSVKCANGTSSTTTNAAGSYTLTIPGGQLPCVIEVTGTDNGVSVTLHSVTEAGTTSGNTTVAVANVTPLTEMIVAQLTGALPSDLFASFTSGTTITAEQLTAATATILTALKDATGIDVTGIDPFKATLAAANGSTAGNTYDQLLDDLGTKVSSESLPLLVTQIASSSTSTSDSGATSLADVMTAANNGAMPGCPTALSGKYRFMEYTGRSFVLNIDFAGLKMTRPDTGATVYTIDPIDTATPCQMVATGQNTNGDNLRYALGMGPQGAGGYRVQNLTNSGSVTGHIFPAQAHAVDTLAGAWTMAQSGKFGMDPWEHSLSKLTVGTGGALLVCDYDTIDNPTCVDETSLSIAARADGGFDVKESSLSVAQMYAYRAPNGSLTVYGTTNAAGSQVSTTEQTHFVAARPRTLTVPAVGTKSRIVDFFLSQGMSRTTSTANYEYTVLTSDATTQEITRERNDSRVDTVKVNHPIPGTRYRLPSTGVSEALQFPLPSGVTVTFNTNPADLFFYDIAVNRP